MTKELRKAIMRRSKLKNFTIKQDLQKIGTITRNSIEKTKRSYFEQVNIKY